MPKTLAVLLITLVISVLGIALAYLVGQRTAEFRMREEMERARLDRQSLLDELRRDLAPPPADTTIRFLAENPAVTNLPEETMTDGETTAEIPESNIDTPDVAPLAVAESETETAIDSPADAVNPEPATPEPNTESAAPPMPEEIPANPEPAPAVVAEESPETTPVTPPITRESFDAIAAGTPYTDVAQRFGREGLAALTMEDASGTETRQVFWDWTGDAGQICRVTMLFIDGRLTDKDYRD